MKTKFQLYTLCSIFIFSGSILYSQTCTQCDNSGNPPGTLASEIGQNTTASGSYSFAGGINSSAIELASFAFGASALANDVYAVSLGAMTTADNSNSFALGSFCKASGTSSFVLGNGPNSASILTNSIGYSLMVGFNSDKSTLFVSPSSGNGSTGKIGIGDVTSPSAKLHIKADEGEQAALFIEPYTFGGSYDAELWMGTSAYGLRAAYGKLYFNTGGHYIFNSQNANMGIGALIPTEKLEVNGMVKATAFTGDGSGLTNVPGSGYWVLNGNDMYCSNTGKIGIGIQIPTAKLEVAGTVKATSFTGNGSALTGVKDYRWQDSYYGSITTNGKVIIGIGNYGGTENSELTDPQLDVRSEEEYNHKLANFVDSDGRRVFIVTKLSESGYSSLPVLNDAGIFWSDNEATGSNQNKNAGFVIAAHKDEAYNGIRIDKDGNVGIGKEIPEAKLDVEGDIKANTIITNTLNVSEFEISTLTVTDKLWAGEIEVTNLKEWKDCVFNEKYNLMSLSETEAFIRQNKHLPGIPSEAEVLENGINVGEMNALLLQKIEELTLYVIELEKKINK
ncbi:MAG: hypothetical protein R2764_23425 [Bacteroidales bacterium]